MLNTVNLDDKTYEERMAQAISQIPLYSDEWTNYNPSEPGITILENFMAFSALQQNQINQITVQIRQKLLKLLGFEARKGKCSRVLIATENMHGKAILPANQRFTLGDMCFETNKIQEIGNYYVTHICTREEDKWTDFDYLCDREVTVPAYIFGNQPKVGQSLYFFTNRLPNPGTDMIFYLTVGNRSNRNAIEGKTGNLFAELAWETYTVNGFEPMSTRDNTGCFLVSGEIRIRMPESQACEYEEAGRKGYVIRATLKRANYDVKPRLTGVSGFMFEVFQKETMSACYNFNKTGQINLFSELAEEGYLRVFAKEEKGSSYREYFPSDSLAEGRFYDRKNVGYGMNRFVFNKQKYGYGPEKFKNSVKIMAYNESMMRKFSLGRVYGYDHQEIKLPIQNIVSDTFSIIARRYDDEGIPIYDFVKPNHFEENALSYHLLENDGMVIIEDAGAFIGADLFIGACAVTLGADGNIREGNEFEVRAVGVDPDTRFYNPGPGTGGCMRERIAEVQKRFLADLAKPYTAVTASDYEKIVSATAQLCIHKVKAVMDEKEKKIRIAVKPGTDEKFPKLSDIYIKAIMDNVEKKRLLTTQVEIVQPCYVPINVQGIVYVKRHYENCRELIEEAVRQKIDYLKSEKNFGDILRFEEVFRAIESLDCVEYIYDLSIRPQNVNMAKLREADIQPQFNCLCCEGEIKIDIGTHGK